MGSVTQNIANYCQGTDAFPLFLSGDSLQLLKEFPKSSVDCCITSPPYWNKRQYENGGIGLEKNPEEYVKNVCNVCSEIFRILKDTGSFWLNIGDSYSNKSLLNIPWKIAIRLTDMGFVLRNTIIWNKIKGGIDNSNDRLRNVYEPIFHFVKGSRYYYNIDQVRNAPGTSKVVNGTIVSSTGVTGVRYKRKIELSTNLSNEQKKNAYSALEKVLQEVKNGTIFDFRMIIKGEQRVTHSDSERLSGRAKELNEKGFYFIKCNGKGSKPSDIWDIVPEDTQGREYHFAPYPEDLCKIPILLTCPPDGVILDPFVGTGTTCLAAMNKGRKSIGIDISSLYIEQAANRCVMQQPLLPL